MTEEPSAAAHPVRRSRENTRARIVEAAVEVFTERPFGRVTVDHVVEAAGYTRGAFYSNFSSIEQLFHEVYVHQADLMLREVNFVLDGVGPGEFHVEAFRDVFAALHPYGRTWFPLHQEYMLLAVRDPEARDLFVTNVQLFQERMEELVQRMLSLLGREPALPVAQIRDIMLALYLHALGTELLGTQQLGAERTGSGGLGTEALMADVLPELLLSLSRPS